jgi:hypothetical protein
MEDVLEVYKRPYNPAFPVVCLDETNRQLIEETRKAIPVKPNRARRTDYKYRRNGVVNLFMMFEPLQARRYVKVKERRTRKDWAECVRNLVDVHYPKAQKVVLVEDNLNTHNIGSLYEAFPAEEARRLAEKLELHYTPKHGSWLNMAEIEIGVLSRQCLSQYIPTKESMTTEVMAWEQKRNQANATVDWQFTTADARIKLKKLYPVI